MNNAYVPSGDDYLVRSLGCVTGAGTGGTGACTDVRARVKNAIASWRGDPGSQQVSTTAVATRHSPVRLFPEHSTCFKVHLSKWIAFLSLWALILVQSHWVSVQLYAAGKLNLTKLGL